MVDWPSSNFYVIAETATGKKFAMPAHNQKLAEQMSDEALNRQTNSGTPINGSHYTTAVPRDADRITLISGGDQDRYLPRK
jgi:hypothetical protein